MQTSINLPFITLTQEGPKHLTMNLTRARFEQLVGGPGPAHDWAYGESAEGMRSLPQPRIDEVILVGGSTRVPLVQQTVEGVFR